MKMISYAMPLALTVLEFIACNRAPAPDRKTAVDDLSAAQQSVTADTASATTDRAAWSADEPKGPDQPAGQTPQQKGIPTSAPANPDWDKKIIKTADLSLEVKNFKSFSTVLYPTMRRFGAYVAQEQQAKNDYRISNTVTIKVPVAQFDEAVEWIANASDSGKLMEKKIGSTDVSTEVIDTKLRLESKRAFLKRYQELLGQAHTMNDILVVQHEIDEVQEQIEGAEGRINYLGHAAAYSTINLEYYQVLQEEAAPVGKEDTFAVRVRDAFTGGWLWLRELILELISLWPLCIAGVLIWMGIRRVRKKTAGRPS